MISIRTRLTLLNIAIVVITLTLMGWALRVKMEANLIAELDRSLSVEIGTVSTGGQDPIFPIAKKIFKSTADHKALERSQDLIEVIHRDSAHVRLEAKRQLPRLIPVDSPEALIGVSDPAGVVEAEKGIPFYHNYFDGNERMRSYSQPILQDGKVIAVAQSNLPLAPIRRTMAEITTAMVMLLPFAAILAAVSGTLLVGSAMRPLRKMKESARELEDDLSGRRLPVQGHDEFSELAATFNDAFDRTSKAFKTQQSALEQLERFTGNAAHELRTPLAAIKGGAGYLLHIGELPQSSRATAESIDRSSDRMIKLISDLLLLARRDSGSPLDLENDVELLPLVEQTCEELLIPSRITLEIQVPPNLRVRIDPAAFQQVVSNLVRNAVAHACSKVAIRASEAGSGFGLCVSDDGDGIPSEHLQRLGERFYRVDSARSRQHGGTGLGLAIAKSMCEAHGGTLRIESVVGEGTSVFVIVP